MRINKYVKEGKRIMVLQNPPTCRSCSHKQASIPEGTPFERDFICNIKLSKLVYKNVLVGELGKKVGDFGGNDGIEVFGGDEMFEGMIREVNLRVGG